MTATTRTPRTTDPTATRLRMSDALAVDPRDVPDPGSVWHSILHVNPDGTSEAMCGKTFDPESDEFSGVDGQAPAREVPDELVLWCKHCLRIRDVLRRGRR